MPLSTSAGIVAALTLDEQGGDALAGRALKQAQAAERETRREVGSDRYDEIVDAGGAELAQLAAAESAICAAIALPRLNLRPSERGGLIRSAGADQTRTEFMSLREAKAYAAEVRAQAERDLDPLRGAAAVLDDLGLAAI